MAPTFDIFDPSSYDPESDRNPSMLRSYSYSVTIKHVDENGDELDPIFITVSTNEVLTPEQITEAALLIAASKGKRYDALGEITETVITGAKRQRGVGL